MRVLLLPTQDRCHRIGQTREVHIYRLISSNTIEENILRKSDQKRQLDWLAIQSGGFNTEMLAKLNLGGSFWEGAVQSWENRVSAMCAACRMRAQQLRGSLQIWVASRRQCRCSS